MPVAVLVLQGVVAGRRRARSSSSPVAAATRAMASFATSHRWQPGRVNRVSLIARAALRILPVAECGSSSTNSTAVGHLNRARLRSQCAISSSAVTCGPGRRTTNALTVWPVYGCGHAQRRRLDDRRVRGQHQLDLVRIDVEPADEDQLAEPVDEEQVAVLVGVGDVAGRPPAVGVGRAGAVGPVAVEEVPRRAPRSRRGRCGDPSSSIVDGAAVHRTARVDELQLDAGDRPADRAGLRRVAGQGAGQDGGGLGQPVPLVHRLTGRLDEPAFGGGVQRGRAADGEADPAQAG